MNDYIGPIVSYHLAGGNYRQGRKFVDYALPCGMRSRSSANFVGFVVGFLNVFSIRLRSLLLAAALSIEIEAIY
jgi:hypothetical protein